MYGTRVTSMQQLTLKSVLLTYSKTNAGVLDCKKRKSEKCKKQDFIQIHKYESGKE